MTSEQQDSLLLSKAKLQIKSDLYENLQSKGKENLK